MEFFPACGGGSGGVRLPYAAREAHRSNKVPFIPAISGRFVLDAGRITTYLLGVGTATGSARVYTTHAGFRRRALNRRPPGARRAGVSIRRDQALSSAPSGRGTSPTPVNCEGGCVTHGRSTQPARPASAHIPEATVRHPVPPWGIRIADCLTDLIPGDRASCPSHDPFRTGRGLDPANRKPRRGSARRGFNLRGIAYRAMDEPSLAV
jgi:hypothetical protein